MSLSVCTKIWLSKLELGTYRIISSGKGFYLLQKRYEGAVVLSEPGLPTDSSAIFNAAGSSGDNRGLDNSLTLVFTLPVPGKRGGGNVCTKCPFHAKAGGRQKLGEAITKKLYNITQSEQFNQLIKQVAQRQ